MKKQILTLFAVLLLPMGVEALPVGNPWDASLLCNGVFWNQDYDVCDDYCDPYFDCLDIFSIRLGFYGDYVFNRKLEIDRRNRNNDDLREARIHTNGGLLVLNIFNIADLYGVLGATKLSFKTPEVSWGVADNHIYYLQTDANISYTAGVRVTLFEADCFGIGADGKYFYTRPKVNSGRREGDVVEYFSEHVKYEEWQVSLGAAYLIPISCTINIVPYAAIQWAHGKADFDNLTTADATHVFRKLKSQHDFGYSLGLTLVGWDRWSATLEGRFIDECAFHLNIQFQL